MKGFVIFTSFMTVFAFVIIAQVDAQGNDETTDATNDQDFDLEEMKEDDLEMLKTILHEMAEEEDGKEVGSEEMQGDAGEENSVNEESSESEESAENGERDLESYLGQALTIDKRVRKPIYVSGRKYCVQEYGPYGKSTKGDSFSDEAIAYHGDITKIYFRYGRYLDGMQVSYGQYRATFQGKKCCNVRILHLGAGEYINHVEVRAGKYVNAVSFSTNKHKSTGWIGGNGRSWSRGEDLVVQSDGKKLAFISGRIHKGFHQISFWFYTNMC